MKKHIWSLVAIVLVFSCGVVARHYASPLVGPLIRSLWAPEQIPKHDPIIDGRISVYENTPGTAEIVMLGDSLTDWGNWNELLPGLSLINRGIAGDTSAGVITRLGEIIQRKPNVVALMIGVNDILQGSASETV